MNLPGSDLAPNIRVILQQDRDWAFARAHTCGDRDCPACRTRRRAAARLTKQAIQYYLPDAAVNVRQKYVKGEHWLYIDLETMRPTIDSPKTRRNLRGLLLNVGIAYRTFDGGVSGKRAYIKLAINGGPFRYL